MELRETNVDNEGVNEIECYLNNRCAYGHDYIKESTILCKFFQIRPKLNCFVIEVGFTSLLPLEVNNSFKKMLLESGLVGAVKIDFKLIKYYNFMKLLFKDFEVIDSQYSTEYGNGHPDFIIKDFIYDGKEFGDIYVEMKNELDSLRMNQLSWMTKNQDKTIWILHCVKCGEQTYNK